MKGRVGAFAALLLLAGSARAQPLRRGVTRPAAGRVAPPPPDLRGRFGLDVAARLLRSTDPDDRLRGLQRVAATRTPEALALLETASGATSPGGFDPRSPLAGVARNDPRALLVIVRALAGWTDQETARAALAGILSAPTPAFATRVASPSSRDPAADEEEGAARVLLARREAAIALAASGDPLALEALVAIGRSGGPGQAAALDALAVHPPSAPLLGGVRLTTPATVALAVAVGDLRSIDVIAGEVRASDGAVRSAAIAALGEVGDASVVGVARAALHDHDARVRVAAAEALVRLGTADAAPAVEALVADDATTREGLRLAAQVQGEGVAKACAARAAASADPAMRAAAIAALGRQTSPAAIGALTALARDPAMQGDATAAIARSPSAAATPALEALALAPATRRLAARAYFVRRYTRGERRASLDGLLEAMAVSHDAPARAIGIEALVALGERPLAGALGDADARVRRAAAMGAMGRWSARSRDALLEGLAVEKDPATREVLAFGLVDGGADARVPTQGLAEWAAAGGADAPLAALALARRAADEDAPAVDALLASRDPVIREHAARGLARSRARDAVGRLARAYAWEADAGVRRAVVEALAAHAADGEDAPALRDALAVASRLDPDAVVRWTAGRALDGAPFSRTEVVREVAWVRLLPAAGAGLPHDVTAALLLPDGAAVPFAFDDDGYALVPGVQPGQARVRLAPRLPSYEASAP